MKRLLASLLILASLVMPLLAAAPASAQAFDICTDNTRAAGSEVCRASTENPNPILGPSGLLTKGIQVFAIITGITSVFIIMLAGLQFITSSGNPDSVGKARDTIIYAFIGIGVTVVAESVVVFVLSKTG